MKIKRVLLTTTLAFSIATNNLFALVASANSISPERKEYVHEGYTVTYCATQNTEYSSTVEVTIQNTGNSTIKGWAVEYMSADTIDNIWNADVYCITDDGYPIINCTTYNLDIKPNESVSFGYAIDTNTFAPDDIKLSQLRMEKEYGFDVNFFVENEWDTGFNGIIEISNTTDIPIIDWQLAFGSNFSIVYSDTFEITTNSTDYYVIEGTYNNYIAPNSSVLMNFVGEKTAEEANIVLDYLSEIIPYFDTNNANTNKYYTIHNYSNDEFPLNFDITVDEDTLDFDMYNMQIMGIPSWNTSTLEFSITPYINENFLEFDDFKLIISNGETEKVYTSGDIITDLSLDMLYEYTVELLYEDEFYTVNIGNFIVCTSVYNSLFILNDYSEVNSTGASLFSNYSCLYDNDISVTGSSTYNNDSMECALNSPIPINFENRTSACGDGYIRYSTDGDYYAITVPQNSTTKISLTVPNGKYYNLYVYNSSKKLVYSKTASGNKYISFNNTSGSQTYYILVCGKGWAENSKSSYYSISLPYSLNITNAKNNRIWFGQQAYKVGTYEYWNAQALTKLYLNGFQFFNTTWKKPNDDWMEDGCNLTAIAMVLRNLGKCTKNDVYDFRLSYTGNLSADPYAVMLANINSNGAVQKTSLYRYDLTTNCSDPMSVGDYDNIASYFDATYDGKIELTGLTTSAKAAKIMEYLNNGYNTQGVIIRTNGHSVVVFKSNTPSASNVADRFYVYDPSDVLYSDGLHKWSSNTNYPLAKATSIILFSD